MACIITFDAGTFSAPTGRQFTLDLTPPDGVQLSFFHVKYAGGDTVKAAPYTFTVVAEVQDLEIFYEPASDGQEGKTFTLVEVCGATNQPLRENSFDPNNVGFGISITGVPA